MVDGAKSVESFTKEFQNDTLLVWSHLASQLMLLAYSHLLRPIHLFNSIKEKVLAFVLYQLSTFSSSSDAPFIHKSCVYSSLYFSHHVRTIHLLDLQFTVYMVDTTFL